MTDRAVAVVAFDVNETLVDMTGLRPAFADASRTPPGQSSFWALNGAARTPRRASNRHSPVVKHSCRHPTWCR